MCIYIYIYTCTLLAMYFSCCYLCPVTYKCVHVHIYMHYIYIYTYTPGHIQVVCTYKCMQRERERERDWGFVFCGEGFDSLSFCAWNLRYWECDDFGIKHFLWHR